MFCSKCGNKIADDAVFCKFCGQKVDQDEELNIEDRKTRTTVFDGELHKCPNCGENLKSFVPNCPACGYELRWTKNGTNKVQELLQKLNSTRSITTKKEIIANFYVPNTKEDLFEFFTLAISQIDDDTPCAEAWYSKLEQTLIKAEMTFGKTADYEYLKKLFDKATNKKKIEDNKKNFNGMLGIIIPGMTTFLGFFFLVIGLIISSATDDAKDASTALIAVGAFVIICSLFMLVMFYALRQQNKKREQELLRKKEEEL